MTITPEAHARLREAIARIGDPRTWYDRDIYVQVMTPNGGCDPQVVADIANRRVRDSLATADAILALPDLAAVLGQGVPPGWVMVPRDATEAMRDEATRIVVDTLGSTTGKTALNWEEAASVWSAMLAAAPPPPHRPTAPPQPNLWR